MSKSKKIRASARDEDCSLRLTMCSGSDTTVLAHIGRDRGTGIKCADSFAVYSCSACHDIIDGRTKHAFTRDQLNSEKLRALEETQGKLFAKGLLNVI